MNYLMYDKLIKTLAEIKIQLKYITLLMCLVILWLVVNSITNVF